jgi:hypothetical protein
MTPTESSTTGGVGPVVVFVAGAGVRTYAFVTIGTRIDRGAAYEGRGSARVRVAVEEGRDAVVVDVEDAFGVAGSLSEGSANVGTLKAARGSTGDACVNARAIGAV